MTFFASPQHPVIRAALFSIFFCAAALVLTRMNGPIQTPDIWGTYLPNRLFLLVGLVFVAMPHMEATAIALQDDGRRWRGPFFLYAMTAGWFYATGCVLLLWGGPGPIEIQIPIWLIAGASFGLVMAWLASRPREEAQRKLDARRPYHDLSRSYLKTKSARIFLYIWPAVALVATLAVLFAPPLKHPNPMFLPFLMVLFANGMGAICPPAKYPFSWLNPGIGAASIVLGLVV